MDFEIAVKCLLKINRNKNFHYIKRYINFIRNRKGIKIKGKTDAHHFLPKAKDFFPEYKNLKENPWNCVHLTFREHLIAHRILALAFPKSSQYTAYYNMSNIKNRKDSRLYAECREYHRNNILKIITPERNAKISASLKGREMSPQWRAKLSRVKSDEERQKLSRANKGRKWTYEARKKFSISRTGKTKASHSLKGKENIAKSKMKYQLIYNEHIFYTYDDMALFFSVDKKFIHNVYRCLDKVPRQTKLSALGLYTKGLTWRQMGFDMK